MEEFGDLGDGEGRVEQKDLSQRTQRRRTEGAEEERGILPTTHELRRISDAGISGRDYFELS